MGFLYFVICNFQGVINVIMGDAPNIGAALLTSPKVSASFTGLDRIFKQECFMLKKSNVQVFIAG